MAESDDVDVVDRVNRRGLPQEAASTITITNSGNAALTITGMTAPGGVYTASSTTGTIEAGGALPVKILFKPTTVQSYNGTLTVNGDQTSGTNILPISGAGMPWRPRRRPRRSP